MRPISVTAAVFQLDRSREVNALQLLNILFISVTAAVFQFEMPSRVVRLMQDSNMLFMLVTLAVFQPVRSSDSRLEHSWNI